MEPRDTRVSERRYNWSNTADYGMVGGLIPRPRLAGADTHRSGGDQPEDTSEVSPIGENHQRFPNSVSGTVLYGGDGAPPSSGEGRCLVLFADTRRAPQVGAPTGMLAHLDALISTDGEF